ncbi:MAG: lipopolysaccharide kinase InaA family protein, partial [archaeon]
KTFLNRQNFKKICEKIGQEIGKLHSKEIIHGDLTTDNIIIEGKRIAFVDFGLGFFSKKTEDFATDLLSMKKTFLSTHFVLKCGFEAVLKGYRKTAPGAQKTIETIAEIEARTRYS